MSLPLWPADVEHKPLRPAFRLIEPDVPPYETEFEGGFDRRRPRSTLRRQLFAFGWDWEDEEFERFRSFYDGDLGEGSLRFEMPVYDGATYALRICKFKGMYEAARPARFWRVTAQLHVYGGA